MLIEEGLEALDKAIDIVRCIAKTDDKGEVAEGW